MKLRLLRSYKTVRIISGQNKRKKSCLKGSNSSKMGKKFLKKRFIKKWSINWPEVERMRKLSSFATA